MTAATADDGFGPVAPGRFDFTPIFELTILSILPIAVFLVSAALQAWLVWRCSKGWTLPRCVSSRNLLVAKLIFAFLYTCSRLALLIMRCRLSKSQTHTSIAEPVLGVVEGSAIMAFSYFQHQSSIRQSTLLNGYLFLSVLFSVALARSYWLQYAVSKSAMPPIFSISLAFKACLFVLEECPKSPFDGSTQVAGETTAGIVNRTLFWWVNRVLLLGYRSTLKTDDLGPIDSSLHSEPLLDTLTVSWRKVTPHASKHALLKCILLAFRRQVLAAVIPRLLFSGFTFSQTFLTTAIIEAVGRSENAQEQDDRISGLISATALVYTGLAVTGVWYKHATFRFLTMCRGSITSLIYDKTLDLHGEHITELAPVTLMSTDIESIVISSDQIHDLWASLLEVPVAIYLLYRQIGVASLLIIVPSFLSTVGTWLLTPYFAPAKTLWNAAIQKRVGETSLLLSQVKSSKMMGLLEFFGKRIENLRNNELAQSSKFRLLQTYADLVNAVSTIGTPSVVLLAAILWVNSDRNMSTEVAFTALTIITIASKPISVILFSWTKVLGALAGFSRIQEFLLLPTHRDCRRVGSYGTISLGPAIKMADATFGTAKGKAILHKLSFEVKRGTLCMVVGSVGCGKSSLIKALSGELDLLDGSLNMSTEPLACCYQKPWLRNCTIKENIIGQCPFEDKWFLEVVLACALDIDLDRMPLRESTVVGTGGMSLSGGQQQRIALARTVYSRCNTVLLDDVFSGLDTMTARATFGSLLGVDGLLRRHNQTVILATTNRNLLLHAQLIVMLEDGMLSSITHQEPASTAIAKFPKGSAASSTDTREAQDSAAQDLTDLDEQVAEPEFSLAEKKQRLEQELSRATGDWECYKIYCKALGPWIFSLCILGLTLRSIIEKMPSIYLRYWTQAGTNSTQKYSWMGGFIAMTATNLIFHFLLTSYYFMIAIPVSSRRLHEMLLQAVLWAPLYFFTSTDSGNILNRFSQDMTLVDQALPFAFFAAALTFIQAVIGVSLIVSGVSYFAAIIPFIIIVLFTVQKYYLRTSRQVRFLDIESKAPLYTHFSETISGICTVRAFGWRRALMREHHKLLNNSQLPFYIMFCIQRWLQIVLDLFVAIVAVGLTATALKLPSSSSKGAIGVSLINLIGFNVVLSVFITLWTQLETSLGAIARLKWFISNAGNENKPGEDEDLPLNWPTSGKVELRNVTASYSSGLDPVLKGVSVSLSPGQKVGICGRSGSGKSSLIATLLRLADLQGSGSIHIDGVDLANICRQTVRSRISTLPQHPFHMSGTVRSNLDPAHAIESDHHLVEVLQKTTIWPNIEKSGGLDASFDGLGLSTGQMQLFSISRLLLHLGKLVLLDEATSSVDWDTDDQVRAAIAPYMEGRTWVEVAHRLHAIRDYDIVIVMHEGRIAEIGEPDHLLQQSKSMFKDLWEDREHYRCTTS